MTASEILFEIHKTDSSDRKKTTSLYTHLEAEIKKMIYGLGVKENIDDLNSASITSLYLSLLNKPQNEIWEKCREMNSDSIKILTDYLYKTIKSAIRAEKSSNFYQRENLRLTKTLRELLSESVEKNRLKKVGDIYYNSKNVNEPQRFNGITTSLNVWIINKDGSINRQALKQLLNDLFNGHLEKYSLSYSDIKDVIIEITGRGNQSQFSIDTDAEEGSPAFQVYDPDKMSDPSIIAEAESLIKVWMERLYKYFEDDELRRYAEMYVLKYHFGIVLVKIAERVGVSKSTVDNRIREFLSVLSINRDFDSSTDSLPFYLDYFALHLTDIFQIEA